MNHPARLGAAPWALVILAFAVGCGGTSTPSTSPTPQGATAYLVYPTSAPTFGPGQTPPPPPISGTVSGALAFAVQNASLNSTYQVVLVPTPPPIAVAFASACPSGVATPCPGGTTTAAPPYVLNLNPTALPSPLALPPISGTVTYVTAQGPLLASSTAYGISLVGCASGTAGCSSPQTIPVGVLQTGCATGTPIPFAILPLTLAQPANGATGVADATSSLLVQGSLFNIFGPLSLSLKSSSGTVVPVGGFTPAPIIGPAPSPAPSQWLVPIEIPLSPATTYTVTENEPVPINTPPTCTGNQTFSIGSFTTQ